MKHNERISYYSAALLLKVSQLLLQAVLIVINLLVPRPSWDGGRRGDDAADDDADDEDVAEPSEDEVIKEPTELRLFFFFSSLRCRLRSLATLRKLLEAWRRQ